MLRGEPKGQASPVPTGRPGSPLSSLGEDQDPGRGQTARPPPGAHRPSPALRRFWTARAARACSAALRPARGDERAGLRGRQLIGASCKQGSWEVATAAPAHDQDAHTLASGRVNLGHVDFARLRAGFIRRGSSPGLAGILAERGLETTWLGAPFAHLPLYIHHLWPRLARWAQVTTRR